MATRCRQQRHDLFLNFMKSLFNLKTLILNMFNMLIWQNYCVRNVLSRQHLTETKKKPPQGGFNSAVWILGEVLFHHLSKDEPANQLYTGSSGNLLSK